MELERGALHGIFIRVLTFSLDDCPFNCEFSSSFKFDFVLLLKNHPFVEGVIFSMERGVELLSGYWVQSLVVAGLTLDEHDDLILLLSDFHMVSSPFV